MKNRKKWVLAGIVAAIGVAAGAEIATTKGTLFTRSRTYLLARCRGRKADLTHAVLRDASLAGANLQRAQLTWADLRGADLRNADLRNAQLSGTDLRNANLAWADLRNACLLSFVFVLEKSGKVYNLMDKPTYLCGANLRGADLRGAGVSESLSRGMRDGWNQWTDPIIGDATYDKHTRWPAGFDPVKHGALLVK